MTKFNDEYWPRYEWGAIVAALLILAALVVFWFGVGWLVYNALRPYVQRAEPERAYRYTYIDLTSPCIKPHLSRRDERAVCAMQAAAEDYRMKRANGRHP